MGHNILHANHNRVCAIDVETTGLDPSKHEIIQIAVIPVDYRFEPDPDLKPFCITMRPNKIANISDEALRVNGLSRQEILHAPLTQDQGLQMFYDWYGTLGIRDNKQIMPLGQNYAFDRGFLQEWMGMDNYSHHFHYHFRDSMLAAQFLNDKAFMHGDTIPFPHVGLGQLAKRVGLEHPNAHSALADALMSLKVYKRMFRKIT